MRFTIVYSKIKKQNLVLINNDTYQRETVSERPIRSLMSCQWFTEYSRKTKLLLSALALEADVNFPVIQYDQSFLKKYVFLFFCTWQNFLKNHISDFHFHSMGRFVALIIIIIKIQTLYLAVSWPAHSGRNGRHPMLSGWCAWRLGRCWRCRSQWRWVCVYSQSRIRGVVAECQPWYTAHVITSLVATCICGIQSLHYHCKGRNTNNTNQTMLFC